MNIPSFSGGLSAVPSRFPKLCPSFTSQAAGMETNERTKTHQDCQGPNIVSPKQFLCLTPIQFNVTRSASTTSQPSKPDRVHNPTLSLCPPPTRTSHTSKALPPPPAQPKNGSTMPGEYEYEHRLGCMVTPTVMRWLTVWVVDLYDVGFIRVSG